MMKKAIIHYVLDFILFVGCLVSILRGTGDWYDYWAVYGLMFIALFDVYSWVWKHRKEKTGKKNANNEKQLPDRH